MSDKMVFDIEVFLRDLLLKLKTIIKEIEENLAVLALYTDTKLVTKVVTDSSDVRNECEKYKEIPRVERTILVEDWGDGMLIEEIGFHRTTEKEMS